MDILRYKNPYIKEKDQFKVVRAPSQSNSDETTSSIKDNSKYLNLEFFWLGIFD